MAEAFTGFRPSGTLSGQARHRTKTYFDANRDGESRGHRPS